MSNLNAQEALNKWGLSKLEEAFPGHKFIPGKIQVDQSSWSSGGCESCEFEIQGFMISGQYENSKNGPTYMTSKFIEYEGSFLDILEELFDIADGK